MRYLIQPLDSEPFFTDWFTVENNYSDGMIVYDLQGFQYYDGTYWETLEFDHL